MQINSWINSKDFYIKSVVITPSESILIFSWIITNFEKLACFEQFVWAWCNIFASFFCLGCYVQNLFFHLLAFILSYQLILYLFEDFQFYARTSHPLIKVRLEKSNSLFLGPENVLQFNASHRHYCAHCWPETKKTGDSSNACVCL